MVGAAGLAELPPELPQPAATSASRPAPAASFHVPTRTVMTFPPKLGSESSYDRRQGMRTAPRSGADPRPDHRAGYRADHGPIQGRSQCCGPAIPVSNRSTCRGPGGRSGSAGAHDRRLRRTRRRTVAARIAMSTRRAGEAADHQRRRDADRVVQRRRRAGAPPTTIEAHKQNPEHEPRLASFPSDVRARPHRTLARPPDRIRATRASAARGGRFRPGRSSRRGSRCRWCGATGGARAGRDRS